jgi:crotonobetainyl-CoA:carnitine CoA-transferase CaiB-like acyl-CoA transferase
VLGGEPSARAGRCLADLGAHVTRVTPIDGDLLDARPAAVIAWGAGTDVIIDPGRGELRDLACDADVVIDEPHDDRCVQLDPEAAPETHWLRITPFGSTGPRARWRASDLGVMAASGNLYATGDPDRAPVRPSEPASYAHVAGEAAYGAIAALASGRRQIVDVSMQECVLVANMAAAGRQFREPGRVRRSGAKIGRTREIYPTLDGFVSFGIRGGAARQASMTLIATLVREAGIAEPALDQDWTTWSQNTAPDDELAAMERAIGAFFATKTSSQLYAIACATNLMLAPVNSPREVFASEQLAAREWFVEHLDAGDVVRIPRSFVTVHGAAAAEPRPRPTPASRPIVSNPSGASPWSGINIVEFGSGAAGPIATRYFAEHGATVLRIESPSRPDFLRAMAVGPNNPHGLEGASLYDALNCGKRHVTFNLKHPDAIALVKRIIVEWADAVAENYAPRAMTGFGLGYDDLRAIKPDLVMISACLNGQTGPHKDYPGFGGQGSALSGWNWVTGWPDREPVGPFGTITDSLAPRYVATALAAGLWYRRTTGLGCYLDVAQVEAGLFALSPWLVEYAIDATIGMRSGNANHRALLHGVYPCADDDTGDDRWIAIAAWTSAHLAAVERLIGCAPTDETVAAWTRTRGRHAVADALQAEGVEAVPVADFADVLSDPQLAHRDHFERHRHPFMGEGVYERNGLRFSDASIGYDRAGPTLGQDNEWVLDDLLSLDPAEIERLRHDGAFA